MKQGTVVTKIVMFLLFAVVLIYLGGAIWRSLSKPYNTVLAYRYTMDDSVEATGWLVRDETVLAGGDGILDVLLDEGEKAAAGETVAVFYRDQAALERKQQLSELELKLEQLNYYASETDQVQESVKLDDEIVDAIAGLKYSVVTEDFTRVSNEALSLKNLVFRREYSYSSDVEDGVQALITETSQEIQTLKAAAALDTTDLKTSLSGIFSAQVDGYESLLTPGSLTGLSPSSLRTLTGQAPGSTAGVGKIITSSKWYLAAIISQEDAERLSRQSAVSVSFSRAFPGEVSMQVESVSGAENGEAAVVLSSTRQLSQTTLLRCQTVNIIFNHYTGIRVPKKALRVITETVTDKETGSETERQTTGVYTLTGVTTDWKPADVVVEGDDYYLLRAPTDTDAKRILREGDEVIIASHELYDGKVVQ